MANISWDRGTVNNTISSIQESIAIMNQEKAKILELMPTLEENWKSEGGMDTAEKLKTFLNDDLSDFINAIVGLNVAIDESGKLLDKINLA